MIHEILIVIFFTYIWVIGVKIATSEGMILEKLGTWGEEQEEENKIFKGLITCPWCLPGVHSIVGWGYAFILGGIPFEWNWKYLVMWPIIIMGSSLCAGLTWTIYLAISKIGANNEIQSKYYEHVEEMAFYDLKERKERYNGIKNKNGGKS